MRPRSALRMTGSPVGLFDECLAMGKRAGCCAIVQVRAKIAAEACEGERRSRLSRIGAGGFAVAGVFVHLLFGLWHGCFAPREIITSCISPCSRRSYVRSSIVCAYEFKMPCTRHSLVEANPYGLRVLHERVCEGHMGTCSCVCTSERHPHPYLSSAPRIIEYDALSWATAETLEPPAST